MRKIVIGGNWKLQINTLSETKRVIQSISEKLLEINIQDIAFLKVFIAVPFTGIVTAQAASRMGSGLQIAAQNVHYQETGPFTGEVSIEALKEMGVSYVLVGHSERRHIFGETDKIVNFKIKKVIQHNLTPVFCIGETAMQKADGMVKKTLETQLVKGLKDINQKDVKKIIIAYEPVWAINNKLLNPEGEIIVATPKEAETTHLIIREWLKINYSTEVSEAITIQYGGSMNPTNAEKLLSLDNIDGGLIGGASLSADTFFPIVKLAVKLLNQM